ncbi:hypothetical protein BDZ89DRAFT_1077055 [Hymenopellis radicata]|nr:hypothetical protein BDZ89DRAFT_1077055 [Hymenopellis radicata]
MSLVANEPRLSIGVELEYLAVLTSQNTRYQKGHFPKADLNRLHLRIMTFIAAVIEAAFKDMHTAGSPAPPRAVAIPADATSPQAHIAQEKALGHFEDGDENSFWICKKETLTASFSHPSLIPFGIEITSPPLVDDSETTRDTWITAIQTVLGVLEDDLRRLVEPDAAYPDDGELQFHLTAPVNAGIHVHVGAGIEKGAKLADLAVKNIAILSWHFEDAIDTLHFQHRQGTKVAVIQSFASESYATDLLPKRPMKEDNIPKLNRLYDLPLTVFVNMLTRGLKSWKVNLSTPYSTIEFRQLGSTFQEGYVVAWVKFVLAFVRVACKFSQKEVLQIMTEAHRSMKDLIKDKDIWDNLEGYCTI